MLYVNYIPIKKENFTSCFFSIELYRNLISFFPQCGLQQGSSLHGEGGDHVVPRVGNDVEMKREGGLHFFLSWHSLSPASVLPLQRIPGPEALSEVGSMCQLSQGTWVGLGDSQQQQLLPSSLIWESHSARHCLSFSFLAGPHFYQSLWQPHSLPGLETGNTPTLSTLTQGGRGQITRPDNISLPQCLEYS